MSPPTPTPPPPEREVSGVEWRARSGMTDWLGRHPKWVGLFLLALLLLNFNGTWRGGVDSGLFRQVARELAEEGTFTYFGHVERQAYPGLVVMLAGLRRVFGETDLAPVVLNNLFAVLAVVMSYLTIGVRFPKWVAVTVALGVGFNARFLMQSQEVLTDMPFFGLMMLAWYGWERLAGARSRGAWLGWATATAAAFGAAAATRPTFWIVVVALGLAGAAAVARGRLGGRHWAALGLVGAVALGVVALDPRLDGMNVLTGAYELRAVESVGERLDAIRGVPDQVLTSLGRTLPQCFYGQPMSPALPVGLLAGGLLLWGAGLVTRRVAFWGLSVYILAAVTVVMSAQPRYYLMVLPVLWLGWILLGCHAWAAAQRRLGDEWAARLLSLVVLLPLVSNVPAVINVTEDRRAGRTHQDDVPLAAIAEGLRRHVAEDEVVIGPYGRVVSYLSDRLVIGDGELTRAGNGADPLLQALSYGPSWVIVPPGLYAGADTQTRKLLESNQITPKEPVIEIARDKYDRPIHLTRFVDTLSLARDRAEAEQRAQRHAAKERKERNERNERKRRKAAKERRGD